LTPPLTLGAKLYLAWAAAALGVSMAVAGATAETFTRLLVLAFLGLQFAFRARLARALPGLAPRVRFLVLGVSLAAVVEGFHMISKPVYPALRIDLETPLADALRFYAIDLLVTTPAYVGIFATIWALVRRYRYSLFSYTVLMGLGQALGDGGLWFFVASPAMLAFLPYPMTNYHACNVLPFWATRDPRPPVREERRRGGWVAVPVLIAVYWVFGAVIKGIGRAFGLDPG
jgi:hypothetical protein